MKICLVMAVLTCTYTLSASNDPTTDGPHLRRLFIGKSSARSITSSEDDHHTWRLGRWNQTTEIDAAYRYGDNIIIFGWIGCCSGVTTIIDAKSGMEKLEFLEYDPHITPRGLIVFRRFYPHFTEPSMVSDAVAELDLEQQVPRSVPSRPYENPTDQVGTIIYPEVPTPDIRHDIGHNIVVSDAGSLLFLADRLSSGKLCVVRLSLDLGGGRAQKENCAALNGLGVRSLSDVHIREFAENAFGDLMLSVDVGAAGSSIRRDFQVDKNSLEIATVTGGQESSGERTLSIPWAVQRGALTFFVPTDIGGSGQRPVQARLGIDTAGNVRDVVISGAATEASKAIKNNLLQWKFKPTVLDGRPVRVVTEFTSTTDGLRKLPE